MINLKLNHQINFYLTSLLAFFIPIHSKIPPVLIVLMTLNWLVCPSNIRLSVKTLKNNYPLLLLVALYLFYVIGSLFSSNISFGLKVLETNLSLIILPFIYAAYTDNTKEKINHYLKIYVLGCFVYALLCFGFALYAYFKPVYVDLYGDGSQFNMGSNYFFYSYLSLFFHPSYTAMYSVFALIIICLGVVKGLIRFNIQTISLSSVLIIFILLLSSKAGWLGLMGLSLYLFAYFVYKGKAIKILYFLLPLILAFLVFNVYYTPNFSNRIPEVDKIISALKGKDENNKKITTFKQDGNASRIFIWKASYELFIENPLGLGTGDSKEELLEKYKQKGMVTEHENQLNSHNQYLSTALSLGLFGLILFLLVLLIPLVISIQQHYYVVTGFILLVLLNFLFESMLETQKGLVFFSFFYTLLCSVLKNKRDYENSI